MEIIIHLKCYQNTVTFTNQIEGVMKRLISLYSVILSIFFNVNDR